MPIQSCSCLNIYEMKIPWQPHRCAAHCVSIQMEKLEYKSCIQHEKCKKKTISPSSCMFYVAYNTFSSSRYSGVGFIVEMLIRFGFSLTNFFLSLNKIFLFVWNISWRCATCKRIRFKKPNVYETLDDDDDDLPLGKYGRKLESNSEHHWYHVSGVRVGICVFLFLSIDFAVRCCSARQTKKNHFTKNWNKCERRQWKETNNNNKNNSLFSPINLS